MNFTSLFFIPAFIAAVINDLIRSKVIKTKTQMEIYFMCKMTFFLILWVIYSRTKNELFYPAFLGFGAGMMITFPRFKKKKS